MNLILIEKKTEAPDVESFIFDPQEPLVWKAGQYLHYVLHHEPTDDRGSDRWFTISSAPFEKRPMITTRFAAEKGSSFKAKLALLQVGDAIEISGLEGDFTITDSSLSYVFLAGGIGITPFHSILKQADHNGVKLDVTLLYGNRDKHIVFQEELLGFAESNPKFSIHYLFAPEKIDEATIRKCVPDLSKPMFYISGPEPMVKALAEVVGGMGVPKEHIKLDDFPGYGME